VRPLVQGIQISTISGRVDSALALLEAIGG
jgi:hypothetical protein